MEMGIAKILLLRSGNCAKESSLTGRKDEMSRCRI